MDDLFKCGSLLEVFEKTAAIMQQYLGAAGCMVIFRPDPTKNEMHIQATLGFSKSILNNNIYEAGKGMTGACAATGRAIRIDDVSRHRKEFDQDMLAGLDSAHREAGGRPIVSWLAIPIGATPNYGVIKVVNRTSRATWFSDADEQLGTSLGVRLQVIIEKFLFIERMEKARDDASSKSAEAQSQLEQRQEDLMVTMHQLQGPLASMLGSISYLKTKLLSQEVQRLLPRSLKTSTEEELTNLEDFVRDSMALSYGTFTSFALEAGRRAAFGLHNINALDELRSLAKRLQKTNARSDLSFSFYATPDFPVLRMDKKIFISVLYSLIHNAMKYADQHSQVSLVCAVEQKEPVLKVKSVGEPILPSEREQIFEKFGRGRVIAQTGRYHSGVGLGLWVAKKLMRIIGGDLTVELPGGNPRLSIFIVHTPVSSQSMIPLPEGAARRGDVDEALVS
jgi:K+-sensing histidine kinase KdpD